MKIEDLVRLLKTSSGDDAGCEEAFAVLDQYVEAELEGSDVEALLPAIAEHLRNCGPCSEEHAALLVLVREHMGYGGRAAGEVGREPLSSPVPLSLARPSSVR